MENVVFKEKNNGIPFNCPSCEGWTTLLDEQLKKLGSVGWGGNRLGHACSATSQYHKLLSQSKATSKHFWLTHPSPHLS